MKPSPQRVAIEIDHEIAIVTLTRSEQHNGVDFPMIAAVIDAQKQLRIRRDLRHIRAIILRGDGPSFCAGLDFKSVLSKPLKAGWMMSQLWWPFRNDFQTWSLGWRKIGVPVIACIHGNCFGAGLQLALGADFRYATADARISLLEAKWGLIPDMGGASLLPELLPIDRAKELMLTGRILSGAEAHAWGLVTHLADDPLAAARQLAAELATRSPDACAAGKYLLQQSYRAGGYSAERAERLWQRRLIGFANFRIALKKNRDNPDLQWKPRRLS